MHYLQVFGTIFVLVLIAKQDIQDRSVQVWTFPVLFINLIALSVGRHTTNLMLLYFSINLVYSGLVVFLSLYLVARVKIPKDVGAPIGLGDVLFFICSSTYFCPYEYFIFFIVSSCFTLCLHHIQNKRSNVIPLAGYQSIILIFVLLFIEFVKSKRCESIF